MRLLVLGDSIAATCPWSELAVEVENRAVVGARVRDLPAQLDATKADLAVVSVGVNDVLSWAEPPDLAAFDSAMADLAQRCRSVLFLAPQLRFMPWHSRVHRPQLQRQLSLVRGGLAGEWTELRLPIWCWQRDGIHLNRYGNRRLLAAVRRQLRSLVPAELSPTPTRSTPRPSSTPSSTRPTVRR